MMASPCPELFKNSRKNTERVFGAFKVSHCCGRNMEHGKPYKNEDLSQHLAMLPNTLLALSIIPIAAFPERFLRDPHQSGEENLRN